MLKFDRSSPHVFIPPRSSLDTKEPAVISIHPAGAATASISDALRNPTTTTITSSSPGFHSLPPFDEVIPAPLATPPATAPLQSFIATASMASRKTSPRRSPTSTEGAESSATAVAGHSGMVPASAPPPPPLDPPFRGYIETTLDALLVFEAARRGMIPRVTRRLIERERGMIQSGAVFVFDEHESGIKRWTDGLIWSPSRILNNFLVYRQQEKRSSCVAERPDSSGGLPPNQPLLNNAGTHGGYLSNAHGGDDHGSSSYLAGSSSSSSSKPQLSAASVSGLDVLNRQRSGSDSMRSPNRGLLAFGDQGLVKKTMSVNVNGYQQHLVSYYKVSDVDEGRLQRPSAIPELLALEISPEYLRKQNFRFPPLVEIGIDGKERYKGESIDPAAQPASTRPTSSGTRPSTSTSMNSVLTPLTPNSFYTPAGYFEQQQIHYIPFDGSNAIGIAPKGQMPQHRYAAAAVAPPMLRQVSEGSGRDSRHRVARRFDPIGQHPGAGPSQGIGSHSMSQSFTFNPTMPVASISGEFPVQSAQYHPSHQQISMQYAGGPQQLEQASHVNPAGGLVYGHAPSSSFPSLSVDTALAAQYPVAMLQSPVQFATPGTAGTTYYITGPPDPAAAGNTDASCAGSNTSADHSSAVIPIQPNIEGDMTTYHQQQAAAAAAMHGRQTAPIPAGTWPTLPAISSGISGDNGVSHRPHTAVPLTLSVSSDAHGAENPYDPNLDMTLQMHQQQPPAAATTTATATSDSSSPSHVASTAYHHLPPPRSAPPASYAMTTSLSQPSQNMANVTIGYEPYNPYHPFGASAAIATEDGSGTVDDNALGAGGPASYVINGSHMMPNPHVHLGGDMAQPQQSF